MNAPLLNAELGTKLVRWRVLPVVRIDDVSQGIAVAEACLRGGLSAIEITLRTPAALEAIGTVAARFPTLSVGAGSVRQPDQLEAARKAGASFAVSPGSTPALFKAAAEIDLPWLPGVATASEVMCAASTGFLVQKFFPAAAAGGVAALRQFAGPLPNVRFCPTGGIDAGSMPHYLALANVVCVGGSWIADDDVVARRQWDQITSRAAAALVVAGNAAAKITPQ